MLNYVLPFYVYVRRFESGEEIKTGNEDYEMAV